MYIIISLTYDVRNSYCMRSANDKFIIQQKTFQHLNHDSKICPLDQKFNFLAIDIY